jgi:hypothetical protein
VTKETGGSALRNQKGTAAAELVLPGDDRVVPASVALDEAVAIFWINIAAEDTSDSMRLDSDKSCQSRQAMCNNER